MSIRRLQYQIDFHHILSFRDEYRSAVAPYFGFDIEYIIENENTVNESIRLIFKLEKVALFLRKEAIALVYEGDETGLKDQNGIIKLFWDLYEKIQNMQGFTKARRHHLKIHAVDLREKDEIEGFLEKPTTLLENPFGKLDEFSCIYQFKKDEYQYKFEYGNYSEKDIKIYDLRPFNSDFNKDLVNNLGLMGQLEVFEIEKNPSHSKFKSLLSKAEIILAQFNLIKNDS